MKTIIAAMKPDKKIKVRTDQECYFNNKKELKKDEFFEHVPVDWQGKIVPEKGKDNMQDIATEVCQYFRKR